MRSGCKINTDGRTKGYGEDRGPISCRILQVCESVM